MSFVQGVKNFLGGINDTMNYPAVAIGELGAFLSPRGSKAEYYFNDFANSARNTSDMGQDRTSLAYIGGRMAPALATYGALPLWSNPRVIGELANMGILTTGISTLGGFYGGDVVDSREWQQAGNGSYVNQSHGTAPQTLLTGRRMAPQIGRISTLPLRRTVPTLPLRGAVQYYR